MSTAVEPAGQPEGVPNPAETQNNPPAGGEPAAKTFDQDAVDRIVAERLARERAKYSDYNDLKSQAQRLAEIENAQKTEQQRLTERAEQETQARAAAEQRAQELEVQLLRHKVAGTKGLTPAQAARLQGTSEEEIAADADALLAAFAPAQPQQPAARTPVEQLLPGAVPSDGSAPADMNEWMRQRAPRTN
ncbi:MULTISPECIES: DUF4355 domain-containing protein [unclassified Streptomyces]|uniref:capsid assembly scaffolding protein Gp46 family protein n=1 Tax=unclassified Streptomyces TaxID=2593676 RepID=UPI00148A00E3|nr:MULTISPECIES: DUF4355 domain-containing protein [unclassified Streptomyces]